MNQTTAVFTLKLATMLRAGSAPASAIEALASENSPEGMTAKALTERLHEGMTPASALAAENSPAWKLIAAAWHLSTLSGAPISTTLERMSEALTRLDALRQRREVLLAAPKGTVMLIASLPPISFIVAEVLGIDVLSQLVTPAGILLAVTGIVLLIAGVSWGMAMIKTVNERDEVAGFELDLLWIALAGGNTPTQARRIVVHTIDDFEVVWANLTSFRDGEIASTLIKHAEERGVPLRDLVTHESHTLREHSHQRLEKEAERLAIRVLIPLGVCVLPAFVLLGVMPMMMALMG